MSFEATLCLGLIRASYPLSVHEGHRVIDAHGILFVLGHEFDQVVGVNIWSELFGVGLAALWRVDVRVVIAFITGFVAGLSASPHRPVIKTVFLHGLGFDAEVIDLPFTCGTCGITKILHQAGEGGVFLLLPVKVGHSPARDVPVTDIAVAPRVFAGQQHRA